jgi:hypothetical protein
MQWPTFQCFFFSVSPSWRYDPVLLLSLRGFDYNRSKLRRHSVTSSLLSSTQADVIDTDQRPDNSPRLVALGIDCCSSVRHSTSAMTRNSERAAKMFALTRASSPVPRVEAKPQILHTKSAAAAKHSLHPPTSMDHSPRLCSASATPRLRWRRHTGRNIESFEFKSETASGVHYRKNVHRSAAKHGKSITKSPPTTTR